MMATSIEMVKTGIRKKKSNRTNAPLTDKPYRLEIVNQLMNIWP